MSTPLEGFGAALADRYRIERELGAGGMATVYLAEDLKHGREVALKVLRPELLASGGHARFLREITTTANLRHPHILPLFDSGEAGGLVFYVMPFVDGETLRERLDREGQLPVQDAVAITREVADALAYAHAQGVIHRDVKPENILLEAGHATVADFGVARAVSVAGGETLTRTGLIVGTPRYMSPEQAGGATELDGRSDLYSLGCVLYEMLAGEPPFTGSTPASLVRQHLTVEPRPVTQQRPAVPDHVAGLLARVLAKNPADRVNSAAEVARALASTDATTTGPRPTHRRGAWWRRAVIGVAVGLMAVSVGWGVRALLPGRPIIHDIQRIAVLPLDNATGDSEEDFFANGMTREVIGVLASAGVRVLGYRAVAAYRGSDIPSGDIARALGVDALVAGSVIRVGERVQVAVELIDPGTAESLWSQTFSRPAADIVTLQRQVAGEIAVGIQGRLTPEQEARLGPGRQVDPEAYAEYLLGKEQVFRWTEDGFRRAVDHLKRSVARDSTFGPAWATLAMAYGYALFYVWIPPEQAIAEIERTSTRALELDDQLGEAWVARGYADLFGTWDFQSAEREFRRGADLATQAGAFEQQAIFLWEMGRNREALTAIGRAVDMEPNVSQWHSDTGWILRSLGDTATERGEVNRAIELDPTFFEAHHQLSWMAVARGDLDTAERELERAEALAGGEYSWEGALQGLILVAKGDTAGALALIHRLNVDALHPRYAQSAVVYHALGDLDKTYAMLERAIEVRDPDVLLILTSIPEMYPLRGDSRFQELVTKAGIPEG